MQDEDQVTREVETTNSRVEATNVQRQTVSEARSLSGRTVAQQVVWYVVGVIVVFLLLRIILQLTGANQGNGFVDFVYGVSGFFAAPFFGMFSYTPAYGVSYFEVSTLVAALIYLLIGWGITKLLSLGQASAA